MTFKRLVKEMTKSVKLLLKFYIKMKPKIIRNTNNIPIDIRLKDLIYCDKTITELRQLLKR